MSSFTPSNKYLLIIMLIGIFVEMSAGQNCGCATGKCCSRTGYCASTADHCGTGCQDGACTNSNNVNVADIVTQEFFDGIINQGVGDCPGKTFYTRQAFLDSLGSFSAFGTTGTLEDSKKEIAAYFAHVTQETGFMCKIEEDITTNIYCKNTYTTYPCVAGKSYHGRGPLQLTWNYNYGPAGERFGFNGLSNPDIVGTDADVSFKASMWFWMSSSTCHIDITSGKGFGATISDINSMECNGVKPEAVANRVKYYTNYCTQLGVDPGVNLSC